MHLRISETSLNSMAWWKCLQFGQWSGCTPIWSFCPLLSHASSGDTPQCVWNACETWGFLQGWLWTDWLLTNKEMGVGTGTPTLQKRCVKNTNSFPEWVIAMYSASVLDKASVGCFFADHTITALQNMNMYLEMDLWEFRSPAQSWVQKTD